MDAVMSYLSENQLLGVIVSLFAIVFLFGILKSLAKLAVTICLLGLVMVVFFNINPGDVVDKGVNVVSEGVELFQGVKPLLNPSGEEKLLPTDGNHVQSLLEGLNLTQLLDIFTENYQQELEQSIQLE